MYVIGSRTVVCLRPSLGDSHLSEEAARRAGVQPLPRISCKSSYPKGSPEDRLSAGVVYDTTTAIRTDPKGSSEDWRLSAGAVHDTTTADTTSELTSTSIQSAMEGGDMAAWSAPGRDEALRDLSPQHQHHRAAPPDWVTSALARTLSDKLGLQLFNFDMICPEDQPSLHEQLYYVVRRGWGSGQSILNREECTITRLQGLGDAFEVSGNTYALEEGEVWSHVKGRKGEGTRGRKGRVVGSRGPEGKWKKRGYENGTFCPGIYH